MTIYWPTTVPFKFLHSSFEETMGDNRYRFTPSEGRDIVRRKKSKRVDTLSGQIPMTAAQYSFYLEFFEDVLKDGTLRFVGPHPRSLLITEFEITGESTVSPLGLKYAVGVTLLFDAAHQTPWILADGDWEDYGIWDDDAKWNDR